MSKEKVERNTLAKIGQGIAILGAIVSAMISIVTLIAIFFHIGETIAFFFPFPAMGYSAIIVFLLSIVMIIFEMDLLIYADLLDRSAVHFLVGLFFLPWTLLLIFAGFCYFIAAWIPGKPPSHIDP